LETLVRTGPSNGDSIVEQVKPVPTLNAARCELCGALLQPRSALSQVGDSAISIVIPVYNEADQIASNLATILAHAKQAGFPIQLIVVDDGSSDDTWTKLEALKTDLPELIGLRLSRNFGKEAAICAGLSHAHGAACIVMDSDLQHPPSLIPQMVALWHKNGLEVVEAMKKTRGEESLFNKIGARVFYRSLSYLSGYDLIGASDFKLLDRKVIAAWQQMHEQTTFFRGMIAWLGYKRGQLYFEVRARNATRSRWTLWSLLRLAIIAITAFSSLPLQVVTILGGLVLIASFAFSVYALCFYFSGHAVPGFTTVILLQLMIGGALMLSLGIIGTYIARIYEEAKRRPRYLITTSFGSH
jgi:polyisoprenyl-phosphate glycosyltransferase